MSKPTFERLTATRILEVAPNLRFAAYYNGGDDRINACLRNYNNRAFVYVMTAMHEGEEYFLYVGKSKAQYSRILAHSKRLAFDHLYLFESNAEDLNDNEICIIKELKALFNRANNPEVERIRLLLDIDYEAEQDAEKIQHYLKLYAAYRKMGAFGFALPAAVFSALETEAKAVGCNCSEMLQQILEQVLGEQISVALAQEPTLETNMISTREYGLLHCRSIEQVKQYLRQKNRVAGAIRIGRDWIIPRDARFPEDRRSSKRSRVERKRSNNGKARCSDNCVST